MGSGAEPPEGSRDGRGSGSEALLKLKAFLFLDIPIPKPSFIGGSSAAGSPRVELLVKTFAPLAGPILREWRAIFITEKICREVVTK